MNNVERKQTKTTSSTTTIEKNKKRKTKQNTKNILNLPSFYAFKYGNQKTSNYQLICNHSETCSTNLTSITL